MGILDDLNPFKKRKEMIETPSDLESDLPDDLREFRSREEPIPGEPTPEAAPQDYPQDETYMPPDLGLGSPAPAQQPREDHSKIKTDLEGRHKLELIIHKLDVIDTRLKLIEEKTRTSRY